MKRPNRHSSAKPPHIRATDALLAVCKMGMNGPDSDSRIAFALLAETIEHKRDEWGKDGPRATHAVQPEAALAGAY